jgi:hypothetical protein
MGALGRLVTIETCAHIATTGSDSLCVLMKD